jgi:hypothetical protein
MEENLNCGGLRIQPRGLEVKVVQEMPALSADPGDIHLGILSGIKGGPKMGRGEVPCANAVQGLGIVGPTLKSILWIAALGLGRHLRQPTVVGDGNRNPHSLGFTQEVKDHRLVWLGVENIEGHQEVVGVPQR